jgi:uncharacterized delta-60 repeat protein
MRRSFLTIAFVFSVHFSSLPSPNIDWQLLDPAFGTRGYVSTSLDRNSFDRFGEILLQPDGKIVAGGTRSPYSSSGSSVIVRYLANGLLDPEFNSGIPLVLPVGNVTGLLLQSDNKIVAAGVTYNGSATASDFHLLRLEPNGELDKSFGSNGGIVFFDFSQTNDQAFGAVLQPDGKIVLVGSTAVGNRSDFAFARFKADGQLDTSFGTNGKVTRSIEYSYDEYLRDVTLQPDGKIVAAGYMDNGGNRDIAVLRLNSDGTSDLSFGTDGLFIASQTITDTATAVHIQPDGKILVTGFAMNGAAIDDFCALRLTSTGTFDTTFGNAGLVTTGIVAGGSDQSYDSVLLSNGSVLLVGAAEGRIVMVRYLTDGSLDPSFGGTGIVTATLGNPEAQASGVILHSDGSIFLAGSLLYSPTDRDLAIFKFRGDGLLDESFGPAGIETTGFGWTRDVAHDLVIQPDGKIVATGPSRINSASTIDKFAVARYLPNGTLDASFAAFGKSTFFVSNGTDVPNSVALQSDGKIVIVGSAGTGPASNFAALRLSGTGSNDSTFGSGGRLQVSFGTGEDVAYDVAVQDDGKLLMAGYSTINSNRDLSIVRLNVNGTFDTTFATGGGLTVNFDEREDIAKAVEVSSNGEIFLAGQTRLPSGEANLIVLKLTAKGTLDTSFGNNGISIAFTGQGAELSSLKLLPDNSLLGAGSVETGSTRSIVLFRIDAQGNLDTGFGPAGSIVTASNSNVSFIANDLVSQENGKIIIAGYAMEDVSDPSRSDVLLARYNPNGSLDDTFGEGGILISDYGRRGERASAVGLQPSGEIVVAGAIDGYQKSLFLVSRYLNPTLAPYASISGRVVTPDGRGLRNALVSITDQEGSSVSVNTSSLGYFSVEGLGTGKMYQVSVVSKRYRFESKTLQLNANLANVEFMGLE